MNHWRRYRYKNLTFLVLAFLAAFLLAKSNTIHQYLFNLEEFTYIAIFLAGMMFVSTFTMPTGILFILVFAEKINPFIVALIAAAGAVLGDILIFHFVKERIIEEITPIYDFFGGKHLSTLVHSRHFRWSLPVIGALIIASPLPDELGVSLMGLSKMKHRHFILISFVFNVISILITISLSTFIKP